MISVVSLFKVRREYKLLTVHFEFKMCDCHFEFEWEVEFPPFHFEFSGCKRCVTITLSSNGNFSFLHSILSFLAVKDV